jgi:site-specific DNA-methyltransferase (adenine-specific)
MAAISGLSALSTLVMGSFCAASKDVLDRGEGMETHAYAFIHTNDIKARLGELFRSGYAIRCNYRQPALSADDGGFGTSAARIYQLFAEQALALEPNMLCSSHHRDG